MPLIPIKNVKLQDQDDTSVQGFERASRNVIPLDPSKCPHCFKSFHGRGAQGTIINVFTARGKDQWCAECVEKGVREGICIQESKLSKKEKKLWQKYLKKKNK